MRIVGIKSQNTRLVVRFFQGIKNIDIKQNSYLIFRL